jgi:hypothetical protein
VEVIHTPPSNYDGNVTGVINIVLKKERDTGISGQVFSEIPVSGSFVYSFPTYSINYGFRKINLYTSYNGEINFEHIDEATWRTFRVNSSEVQLSSVQQVRQKNLSHKFHYGLDYDLTSRDLISFYGSFNPYSYEQDGEVTNEITGSENGSGIPNGTRTIKTAPFLIRSITNISLTTGAARSPSTSATFICVRTTLPFTEAMEKLVRPLISIPKTRDKFPRV